MTKHPGLVVGAVGGSLPGRNVSFLKWMTSDDRKHDENYGVAGEAGRIVPNYRSARCTNRKLQGLQDFPLLCRRN